MGRSDLQGGDADAGRRKYDDKNGIGKMEVGKASERTTCTRRGAVDKSSPACRRNRRGKECIIEKVQKRRENGRLPQGS